ncbi:hypothetical protein [Streptomyces sp. AF1A]|jgi:hypothetical protein|uniref:hypothetical protein n=1 Tax=Streptomyces sp. AF1A TaxID=3394350 RepID=UPI0039BD003C
MVTEPSPARAASAEELLENAAQLRVDADLMDGYARRLLATAATLGTCPAAPGGSRAALERQAAACARAGEQLRAAAEALVGHVRARG